MISDLLCIIYLTVFKGQAENNYAKYLKKYFLFVCGGFYF